MTHKTLREMNRLTAGGAARRIQEELDEGDMDFAERLISVTLEVIREMDPETHLAEYLANPSTVDDVRWNTLLMTAIRWQLEELGLRAPEWTDLPPLEEELFLYPDSDLTDEWRERIRSRTPQTFAERNIWCDARRDFSTA